VFCLILASALALILAVDFVVSIIHQHFWPWWIWLAGVLAVGVLGIIAGTLIGFNREE
jgi:hypothetical protein